MVKIEEEFFIFDMSDTVNGIGGAMGLFLGWSVLDLAFQVTVMIRSTLNLFDRKSTGQKTKSYKNETAEQFLTLP